MEPLIVEFAGKRPVIEEGAWLAPGSTLVGDVHVAAGASVWFGAVLRADLERIEVGAGSSVQDNAVVHVFPGFPTVIGAEATVGHGAMLEACTIEERALIGIGATLLRGVRIGREALVGAGAVVGEGEVVPTRMLAAGVPARIIRAVEGEPLERLQDASLRYARLAAQYTTDETSSGPGYAPLDSPRPTRHENER